MDPVRRPRPRPRARERDLLPESRARSCSTPAASARRRSCSRTATSTSPRRRGSSRATTSRRSSRATRTSRARKKFLWEGAQEIVFARAERRPADRPSCVTTKSIETGCGEGPDRLAAAQQLGDGHAALVAVVLGELVDVHLDEPVGDRLVDPAAELQRVLERVLAVFEAAADRLGEHVREVGEAARCPGARR